MMKMSKQIATALAMVQDGMTVSLGGGSHVASLAKAMRDANFEGTVISPSELTRQYCQQLGMQVSANTQESDLAFDGCDGIDAQFNLLKSNGGIFLDEQAYAQRAGQYVIMAPLAKFTKVLAPTIPLTLAVNAEQSVVILDSVRALGLQAELRVGVNYMGYVRTNHGHLLIDVHGADWHDIGKLTPRLCALEGVAASSYLPAAADVLIAETEDGQVQIIRKGEQHD
jgi:ribose 5-phosphate isomerase A